MPANPLYDMEPWKIAVINDDLETVDEAALADLDVLASIYHEQWCEYVQSLLTNGLHRTDGSITLPAPVVREISRLKTSVFAGMTEDDKTFARNNAVPFYARKSLNGECP